VLTEHAAFQHGIEVRLPPLTARRLFGVPMDALANEVVALEDLLGRDADRLVERLHDAPGWAARFALLDSCASIASSRCCAAPTPNAGRGSPTTAATTTRRIQPRVPRVRRQRDGRLPGQPAARRRGLRRLRRAVVTSIQDAAPAPA
jgi:hypothetical protein